MKIAPIIVFAILVVASGIVHGIRTDRWSPTKGVDEAVRRLDNVPMEFGDWKGEKTVLDAGDLARAGIKGHLFCRFRNNRTGAAFSILVVCGRAGPISVHTPDVCYEGAGYAGIGSPELRDVALTNPESFKCWGLRFAKPSSRSASQLEIFWAWNGGDGWAAPENPRLFFARYPVLYKLYVIRDVSPREKADKADPHAEFLQEFLPVLNRALTPS
jgi:Protein of unknown function (DUF3485)